VRELLKRGLAAEGFIRAEQGKSSGDYGMIGTGADEQETPTK
jgi:hypothetical protein